MFSIAVHNTDDHLRNHGFLRRAAGWELAPVFDVNPNPEPGARATTVAGASGATAELAALKEYAPLFDVGERHASSSVKVIATAVASWREVARANGIDESEIRRFAPTFESGVDLMGA